ncbi:hypothetical protein [Amycolatopsis sp. NPDC003731]
MQAKRYTIDEASRYYEWSAEIAGHPYRRQTVGVDGPMAVRTRVVNHGRGWEIRFVDPAGVVHGVWCRYC